MTNHFLINSWLRWVGRRWTIISWFQIEKLHSIRQSENKLLQSSSILQKWWIFYSWVNEKIDNSKKKFYESWDPKFWNILKRWAKCLKITKSVAFKIASEASYVYILNEQKLIKNAKNGQFWIFRILENLKFAVIKCYQTFK